MSLMTSEGETGDGQSHDSSGHGVGWIGAEPRGRAENPGGEADARTSNETQREEADSSVEEVIPVVGDRVRICAHENTSNEKEKSWVRERPEKANGRPSNLFEVPE